MNDHRKLVQDCINKRADNHAELLKKLDKTCERIAKNELKVWLSIEEARKFLDEIDKSIDPADKPYSYSKVRLSILNQLEQAEGK